MHLRYLSGYFFIRTASTPFTAATAAVKRFPHFPTYVTRCTQEKSEYYYLLYHAFANIFLSPIVPCCQLKSMLVVVLTMPGIIGDDHIQPVDTLVGRMHIGAGKLGFS
jgi:hypothetical protein